MKILFVCLGNICRSPLAQAIAENLNPNYIFDSAGIGSWHIGQAPCEKSQLIAKIKGLDISNLKARQVSQDDIFKWDKVIAMDKQNLIDLQKMGFKNAQMLLDVDVPDPYFFDSDEGMEELYEMIKNGVNNIIF
jgi:protein-tyrosine phosphatase